MQQFVYDTFATILSYPETNSCSGLSMLVDAMPPECLDHLTAFRMAMEALPLETQQELFTQTFDLSPVCSLELGWHLFGENYERGLLLVRMRKWLRSAGIAEHGELPDHLTYALRLLPTMSQECAADFAGAIVLPGLVKMLQAIQGKDNPFERILSALAMTLHKDFPEIELPEATVELPVLTEEVTL